MFSYVVHTPAIDWLHTASSHGRHLRSCCIVYVSHAHSHVHSNSGPARQPGFPCCWPRVGCKSPISGATLAISSLFAPSIGFVGSVGYMVVLGLFRRNFHICLAALTSGSPTTRGTGRPGRPQHLGSHFSSRGEAYDGERTFSGARADECRVMWKLAAIKMDSGFHAC